MTYALTCFVKVYCRWPTLSNIDECTVEEQGTALAMLLLPILTVGFLAGWF